jgi:hypothetical protein
MIRSSVRLCGRLVISAALSWTLIPIASAEAPSAESPAVESSADSEPDATDVSGGKQLYTIPEDGMGDDAWMSAATRIVRELTARRPKEDLVICIGGCLEKQDRVVYAQAAESPAAAPVSAASDPAPAGGMSSADPAVETAPAIGAAAKATVSGDMKTPGFVPSMATPGTGTKTQAMPTVQPK